MTRKLRFIFNSSSWLKSEGILSHLPISKMVWVDRLLLTRCREKTEGCKWVPVIGCLWIEKKLTVCPAWVPVREPLPCWNLWLTAACHRGTATCCLPTYYVTLCCHWVIPRRSHRCAYLFNVSKYEAVEMLCQCWANPHWKCEKDLVSLKHL